MDIKLKIDWITAISAQCRQVGHLYHSGYSSHLSVYGYQLINLVTAYSFFIVFRLFKSYFSSTIFSVIARGKREHVLPVLPWWALK